MILGQTLLIFVKDHFHRLLAFLHYILQYIDVDTSLLQLEAKNTLTGGLNETLSRLTQKCHGYHIREQSESKRTKVEIYVTKSAMYS